MLLDRQHGFVAIGRERNVEALAVEIVAKHLGLRVLVFDDEHPRFRRHPTLQQLHVGSPQAYSTVKLVTSSFGR
jgi:hypothetical protein